MKTTEDILRYAKSQKTHQPCTLLLKLLKDILQSTERWIKKGSMEISWQEKTSGET